MTNPYRASSPDIFLRAETLLDQQPDFGERHIRSVQELVVGETVQVIATNGEITTDFLEEVVAVDAEKAVSSPDSRSITLRHVPGVDAKGFLIEARELSWRPCALGLAPYPDPNTAPFGSNGQRLVWNTAAVFRVETPGR